MTDETRTPNRRMFLVGAGSVMIAGVLAGCNSSSGGDNGTNNGTTPEENTTSTTATESTQETRTTTAASGNITKQQAKQIATGRVGGTVLNVENDSTNGTPVYEVEITRKNGIGKEVDVDRQNGTIVEIENDSRDDNND